MKEPLDARALRVARLVAVARRLADPTDALGRKARALLPESTGLSPQGVELALTQCLESNPTEVEIRTLCQSVPRASRAHVLLSANVFVAAHRAIALAVAAAVHVEVRASTREPVMAALIQEAEPSLFRLVDELAPAPGDHVWLYGEDRTIAKLRDDFTSGVVIHGHGPGIGVAVVQATADSEQVAERQLAAAAKSLAQDVIPFDQKGCLSPRLALVLGPPMATRAFAEPLSRELARLEATVPRGVLSHDEAADVAWYRDTVRYAAELLGAGRGWVGLDLEPDRLLLPPVGRNVHVVHATDLDGLLGLLAPGIAAVGLAGPRELGERVRNLVPRARYSILGSMQRPRFDGPVDRRPDHRGETL